MNSTSLPPFEILGSLEPPETFLDYSVEIVTRTPAPSGELFEEFLEELSGGACSGLFTTDSATREAYLITAERQRSRRKDTFRFQGRMEGVDLRMFRVLCGLLTQAHHGGDEIASVRVDCGTGGGSRLPAARIMTGDAFPARAAHPPFPCDVLVDPDREKLRTLRVRGERPFDETMFGVAKEALGSWYLLVATGGYQEGFAPIIPPIVGEGECYLVSPAQLEMTLPDCHAPQAALDALVNWAGWLHKFISPVQSVELD